jgi:tRNA threonylcarbamoyladenosine modification (KEOPS) complex Cgi121 subunit
VFGSTTAWQNDLCFQHKQNIAKALNITILMSLRTYAWKQLCRWPWLTVRYLPYALYRSLSLSIALYRSRSFYLSCIRFSIYKINITQAVGTDADEVKHSCLQGTQIPVHHISTKLLQTRVFGSTTAWQNDLCFQHKQNIAKALNITILMSLRTYAWKQLCRWPWLTVRYLPYALCRSLSLSIALYRSRSFYLSFIPRLKIY